MVTTASQVSTTLPLRSSTLQTLPYHHLHREAKLIPTIDTVLTYFNVIRTHTEKSAKKTELTCLLTDGRCLNSKMCRDERVGRMVNRHKELLLLLLSTQVVLLYLSVRVGLSEWKDTTRCAVQNLVKKFSDNKRAKQNVEAAENKKMKPYKLVS